MAAEKQQSGSKTRGSRPCRYLHMVDDQPAYFDGRQLLKANPRQPIPTVPSLVEIRREQNASARYRRTQGYGTHARCGWIKVTV